MAEPVLEWRREEFDLDQPLHTARGSWRRRCTLRVQLRDDSGLTGLGEAAPLPGYSLDTLQSAEGALAALSPRQLQCLVLLASPAELLQAVAEAIPEAQPAARFALETALLDRLSRGRRCPLWETLRDGPFASDTAAAAVPVCALLFASEPEAALREARQHVEQGVRCFKLKIGPRRLLPAQAALLQALRATWGDQIELRLDANQSLERSELADTFSTLATYRPRFVEEPLHEPRAEELAPLACSWALDESLQRPDPGRLESLWELRGCSAIVLKPTALGGFGRCAELAAQARAAGKDVVVSHTLEGTLGWLACAHLAFALGAGAAAGLWPQARRGASPLQMRAGRLLLPREYGLGAGA